MEKRVTNSVPTIIFALMVFALIYLYLQNSMFAAEELGKKQEIPASLIVLMGITFCVVLMLVVALILYTVLLMKFRKSIAF